MSTVKHDLTPDNAVFTIPSSAGLVFTTTHYESDGTTALNLSTYDYELELKAVKSQAAEDFALTKTNARIVVSGGDSNILTHTILQSEITTDSLLGQYHFDLVLTPASGEKFTALEGTINITQGITV